MRRELRILFLYSWFSFHNASELVPFQTVLTDLQKCQVTITSMSSVIKCQALCRWCNYLFFQTMARRCVSTCHSKDNDKLNKKIPSTSTWEDIEKLDVFSLSHQDKLRPLQGIIFISARSSSSVHYLITILSCRRERAREMKSHILSDSGEGTAPGCVSAKVRGLINS